MNTACVEVRDELFATKDYVREVMATACVEVRDELFATKDYVREVMATACVEVRDELYTNAEYVQIFGDRVLCLRRFRYLLLLNTKHCSTYTILYNSFSN